MLVNLSKENLWRDRGVALHFDWSIGCRLTNQNHATTADTYTDASDFRVCEFLVLC